MWKRKMRRSCVYPSAIRELIFTWTSETVWKSYPYVHVIYKGILLKNGLRRAVGGILLYHIFVNFERY